MNQSIEMKLTLTLNAASEVPLEIVDGWAWALERQIEEMQLVEKAEVTDLTLVTGT